MSSSQLREVNSSRRSLWIRGSRFVEIYYNEDIEPYLTVRSFSASPICKRGYLRRDCLYGLFLVSRCIEQLSVSLTIPTLLLTFLKCSASYKNVDGCPWAHGFTGLGTITLI